MKAGIAEDNLENAARGRIAAKNRFDLLPDRTHNQVLSRLEQGRRGRRPRSGAPPHIYYPDVVRNTLIALALLLAGCSSPDSNAAKKSGPVEPQGAATAVGKNPLTKYLEVVGFRLAEASPGKLKVTFAVVNHSQADMGDVVLKIRLTTSAAKPDDPPITEFEAKVPSVGPQEIKDVTETASTKLRIYELPDWQFLRAQFEVISPPPGQ